MTLRKALAKSLNVATIKVAEMVGYGTVVNLAHRAGISEDVKATPAMAIGSYDATPLEMAGAYTIFANKGVQRAAFAALAGQRTERQGAARQKPKTKAVLDPRVAYLMVSMLEEVMRTGTAAGVRSRGFTVPAAGKTGTSHDGWFAGFTSDLLCIVWVGFDDNRELNIEGAHSALPVWTEFMKRAVALRSIRTQRRSQRRTAWSRSRSIRNRACPRTRSVPSRKRKFSSRELNLWERARCMARRAIRPRFPAGKFRQPKIRISSRARRRRRLSRDVRRRIPRIHHGKRNRSPIAFNAGTESTFGNREKEGHFRAAQRCVQMRKNKEAALWFPRQIPDYSSRVHRSGIRTPRALRYS